MREFITVSAHDIFQQLENRIFCKLGMKNLAVKLSCVYPNTELVLKGSIAEFMLLLLMQWAFY